MVIANPTTAPPAGTRIRLVFEVGADRGPFSAGKGLRAG